MVLPNWRRFACGSCGSAVRPLGLIWTVAMFVSKRSLSATSMPPGARPAESTLASLPTMKPTQRPSFRRYHGSAMLGLACQMGTMKLFVSNRSSSPPSIPPVVPIGEVATTPLMRVISTQRPWFLGFSGSGVLGLAGLSGTATARVSPHSASPSSIPAQVPMGEVTVTPLTKVVRTPRSWFCGFSGSAVASAGPMDRSQHAVVDRS